MTCAEDLHLSAFHYKIFSASSYAGQTHSITLLNITLVHVMYCGYTFVYTYFKCVPLVLLQNPMLFDGCDFYLSGILQPPKEDLSRLIILAGGNILSREPRNEVSKDAVCPFHAQDSSFSTCHTFIVKKCTISPVNLRGTISQVPPAWILDCVSHFQLIDTSC